MASNMIRTTARGKLPKKMDTPVQKKSPPQGAKKDLARMGKLAFGGKAK